MNPIPIRIHKVKRFESEEAAKKHLSGLYINRKRNPDFMLVYSSFNDYWIIRGKFTNAYLCDDDEWRGHEHVNFEIPKPVPVEAPRIYFEDPHSIMCGGELIGYYLTEFNGEYTAYFGGRRTSFKTGTSYAVEARKRITRYLERRRIDPAPVSEDEFDSENIYNQDSIRQSIHDN